MNASEPDPKSSPAVQPAPPPPPDLRRVESIFAGAIARPASERDAFLAGACGHDRALRAHVDALLHAHTVAAGNGFMASPTAREGRVPAASANPTTLSSAAITEGPGTRIGSYKILQVIGEGGFGSVFMAEQEQPVRRRVALKIIKLGMDTRQVIARFEAERQALAMMDHPNIARVLDAGATATGRPYFVMELVKGDPVTEYCDKNNLSIPERLELFSQVCNAVQHAHQKGIIHRDLKPSNILVTTQDGRAFAKVIDFGIAKATDHRLTEKTLFTEHRALIGTPEYMSPEQAEGSLDIDTRTDVYSLGVLLYELLTGCTPFDSARLRSAAYAEVQRIIREVEPPKPSTRLSQSMDTLPTVAARRRTEPRKLGGTLRGELDWIVMKALDKDRARRYETASALAADVQRYTGGEAVVAAPPSRAYRVRKFVRRNKGPVLAAGLVAGVLVLGIVGTTAGFFRAEQQKRRAEEQQSLAQARAASEIREREKAELAVRLAEDARAAEVAATAAEREARAEADRLRERAQRDAYAAGLASAHIAIGAGEAGNARDLLDNCAASFRGWEWNYLNARADRSIAVFRGHEKPVFSARFSPDGTQVVTASLDGTVREWNVVGVTQTLTRPTGKEQATGASFSRNGHDLAVVGSGADVLLWNRAESRGSEPNPRVLTGHTGTVVAAEFSPDGKQIATASDDGTVRLWDVSTGIELRRLSHRKETPNELGEMVRVVTFSPDGALLATATNEGILRLFSPGSDRAEHTWSAHQDAINSLQFRPDGRRMVTASDDGTVREWEVPTGRLRHTCSEHRGPVIAVSYSPDGLRAVTAGEDKTVRIWWTDSWRAAGRLVGHSDFVNSVEFSPDGSLVLTAGQDGTARLWDALYVDEQVVLRGHTKDIHSALFSPDQRLVATTSADGSAKLWDSSDGGCVLTMSGPAESAAAGAAFRADGLRLVTAWSDHCVREWNTVTGRCERVIANLPFAPVTVQYLGDDSLLLADSQDGSAWLGTVHGECIAAIRVAEMGGLRLSPDDDHLIGCTATGAVHQWNSRTGAVEFVSAATNEFVQDIRWLADERSEGGPGPRVRTISRKRVVRDYDAMTGELVRTTPGAIESPRGASFNADGTRFLWQGFLHSDPVTLWDSQTSTLLGTLRGSETEIAQSWFMADRVFTSGWDGAIRVWDEATGTQLLAVRDLGAMHTVQGISADVTRFLVVNGSRVTIVDSVPFAARRADLQSSRAQRREGRVAAAAAWTAAPDSDAAEAALAADETLSVEVRRAAVLELRTIVERREASARAALDALKSEWMTKDRVLAHLGVDIAPELRDRVGQLARDWEPDAEELAGLAWAWYYDEEGDPSDEEGLAAARDAARQAVALDEEDYDAAGTLGILLRIAGRPTEGAEYLALANKLCEEADEDYPQPWILGHLATALFKSGQIEQAERALLAGLRALADGESEYEDYDYDAVNEADELIHPEDF